MNKPYAESCVQNREPIEQVLARYVEGRRSVLEIGSGTGQHAVYFAAAFNWLRWQTSDLAEYHPAIRAWIQDSGLDNVFEPLTLDSRETWTPVNQYDLVYSANTLHIMSTAAVRGLFENLPTVMQPDAIFLVYGPFNYHGEYTSESNQRFDGWLRQYDPQSGIKDFDWLVELGAQQDLYCIDDYAMPANNRILVWSRNAREQT